MAANGYGSIQKVVITVKNFSTSVTINDQTAVLFDTSNPGGGDVPPGVAIPSSGGGVVGSAGIVMENIGPGKTGKMIVGGTYPAIADGSITLGNYLQVSDTSGKMGRVKAKGGGLEQLGQALESATDGTPVLVLLLKSATA